MKTPEQKNREEKHRNLSKIGYGVEEEMQLNPNSGKREFSIREPNRYYLTISEFQKYEG